MVPGEYILDGADLELNAGRPVVTLKVTNTGDRPIQVGSHYHFFETNAALTFDRHIARGMRLDIPAGTAVRFEPGQSRKVTLVAFAGARNVYGFRQDVMGPLDRQPSKSRAAKTAKPGTSKSGMSKSKIAAGRPKPARRAPNSTPKR